MSDSRHKGSNARAVRSPVVDKERTSGFGRSFEVPSVLSHCLFGNGNGILPIKICTTYPKAYLLLAQIARANSHYRGTCRFVHELHLVLICK